MKQLVRKIRFFVQKKLNKTKYLRGQKKYNLGKRTYIAENSQIRAKGTVVGKFTSIAGNVIIGFGRKRLDVLSTHGFQYEHQNERLWGDLKTPKDNLIEKIESRPCKIGNDCWICERAMIKEGVTIGDGAVVAAGSIVTKDVPPYAIVGGGLLKSLGIGLNHILLRSCWN